MVFCKVPGLTGKLYLPQRSEGQAQKHACKDCYACQQCSDDRCRVCCSRSPDGSTMATSVTCRSAEGKCP